MLRVNPHLLQFDDKLVADEKRTEPYNTYSEGISQAIVPLGANNSSGAASRQAVVVQRWGA